MREFIQIKMHVSNERSRSAGLNPNGVQLSLLHNFVGSSSVHIFSRFRLLAVRGFRPVNHE